MTIPISLDLFGFFGRKKHNERRQYILPWTPVDPALQVLLDRRDDRLLRDVGLTYRGALGEAGHFWSELARQRDIWKL